MVLDGDKKKNEKKVIFYYMWVKEELLANNWSTNLSRFLLFLASKNLHFLRSFFKFLHIPIKKCDFRKDFIHFPGKLAEMYLKSWNSQGIANATEREKLSVNWCFGC